MQRHLKMNFETDHNAKIFQKNDMKLRALKTEK